MNLKSPVYLSKNKIKLSLLVLQRHYGLYYVHVSPIIAHQKILEFITQEFPEILSNHSKSYEEILKELFTEHKITIEKIAELLGWTVSDAKQYMIRTISG
jgi:hypothetical protein